MLMMMRLSLLVVAVWLAAGSAANQPPPPPQPPLAQPEPYAQPGQEPYAQPEQEPQAQPEPPPAANPQGRDELQLCVDETNRYRAKLRLRPLKRSAELERCAAEGARSDHATRSPHGHFVDTQGCGIAFAENEIPRWPLDYAGSVPDTIRKGIADMWGEGPGGGHYENIRGAYTELGCGIYVDGNSVTVVQDYR
jgi:uncharacterized protein YkwD